jgi:pimeloyl-ACP methyl ester carboxylesterase
VGIPEIVEHYKVIIQRQLKPPVLIGHSFGGLIVQILLDQGLGAAGIAISSVPPRGVSALGLSPVKAVKKPRTLFGAGSLRRGILSAPDRDAEERVLRQAQGVEMYLVPESRRFLQLLTPAANVNFHNTRRAPLLTLCPAGNTTPPFTPFKSGEPQNSPVLSGLAHHRKEGAVSADSSCLNTGVWSKTLGPFQSLGVGWA